MKQPTTSTPLRDGPSTYGFVSRLNHWVIAVTMIGLLVSGLIMAYGPFARETVGAIRDWHKPIGVLVLGYGVWRIGWRLIQGFPSEASIMPRWQVVVSKITHWGLLSTVIAMPVSGIVKSIYGGRPVSAFGLVIPAQTKVEWISNAAGVTHQYASWVCIALVILHTGAALKHHYVDHDTTLRRMLVGSG